ncbi:MAG: recombination regulator RecX [Gammaproteobacteria bacterium]|nr:recombination regulator RecX [Gammaproteobacteria bacterium]
MEKPPKRGRPPLSTKGRAVRLLARREHSAVELKRKLAWRGVDEAEADKAVNELADDGWQSDQRYAESMVRQRVMQGYGPLRIEAELEQSGVDSALVRAAFAEVECDWLQLAYETHARRFAPPGNAKEWQKQYSYLRMRGFQSDHIRSVLKGDPPVSD